MYCVTTPVCSDYPCLDSWLLCPQKPEEGKLMSAAVIKTWEMALIRSCKAMQSFAINMDVKGLPDTWLINLFSCFHIFTFDMCGGGIHHWSVLLPHTVC
jgi:hypothetical protein